MSENIRKMIFSFSFEIGSRGKSVDSTDFSESWFLVGGQLCVKNRGRSAGVGANG